MFGAGARLVPDEAFRRRRLLREVFRLNDLDAGGTLDAREGEEFARDLCGARVVAAAPPGWLAGLLNRTLDSLLAHGMHTLLPDGCSESARWAHTGAAGHGLPLGGLRVS